MGTYAQPGITQGQVAMAEQADYASGLSKTLKTARTSMDNQMAMIETSKNALANQTAELMQEANKIQSSDNSELADSFKQTIIDQIDALDLLEYNSIGRDQTEVTKMRSNLLNGIEGATGNFMKLLAEAEDYNKRVVNGTSTKTVSNTNSNPEAIPFLNALGVNNGREVKTEWDGLGFNLSYKDPSTGKEFKINPTNYYAGREQGLPGLWNEVQDPSPTFKASYDQLAKNFPNINKVTESRGANGELITTTSLDSEKAYDNIRNGILNDRLLINAIDGDTMQFLAGSGYYEKGVGATYNPNDKNQEKEIMEAIANYTMDQYSKGKGEQVRDIRTQLAKPKTKTKIKKGEKGEITKLNHTKFINTLSEITDVQETDSGFVGVPKKKDAIPGKTYVNNKGQRYRFDGDTKEYIEIDKSDKDLETLKVRKLADIKKYLEGKNNVLKGSNKELKEQVTDVNPNAIYRKSGGGTSQNPFIYTEIDINDLFSDDVLDDLDKMENKLNQALGIKGNSPI